MLLARFLKACEKPWSQKRCTVAGELKAEVRRQREALRDQLVANYAREQDALLADILPKARSP